ncbi:MAG: hypothetical protein IIB58_00380 [Planctomycetes bacterium]|nr:hypothetical protein [Planctomycetota bacterium]
MDDDRDIKQKMLEMVKLLPPEQLAELNDAIRDALISAAGGQPSRYAINELVCLSQDEARRICKKIGLNWQTGEMDSADSAE